MECKNSKPNPILKANFLEKWFFIWTHEILKKGYREQLHADNLYDHLPHLDSAKVSTSFIKHWEREVGCTKPNLLYMIFRIYGWHFVPICIIYSLLEILIHALQPLLLGGLVAYFSEMGTDVSRHSAYLYAMGIVLCSLLNSLCYHPFLFYLLELGTKTRLACTGLIYRKCLRAAVTADNNGLSGFAIALLSIDLKQFNDTFSFFHELWKGPLEAAIFTYITYNVIGWSALIGLATTIIFIPLQVWAAKATAHFKFKSAEYADDRVKLMNEIIRAIQVIKMYAWEKSFAKAIAAIRKKEILAIRGSMNIYAALQCTSMISKLSMFLCLVTYIYTWNVVTAQKVFIVSSYYDRLSDSLLHFWPLAINTWAETVVVCRRVVNFLMQCEHTADGDIENIGFDRRNKCNFIGRIHNPRTLKPGILLHELTASWDKSERETKQAHIQNLSFHVYEQQFIGIVGSIGAGKTTLLHALLGELNIITGNVEINGILSYSPQEPWILQTSLRENIVFMEQFDEERYKRVIYSCQLEKDIQELPYGDSTIIGENGISLSGGQKARISFARAVYRQADIYLFDDPLSAVDSHIGQLLLDKCLHEFLANKIRILVTHRVQLLQHVNHLILMEDGRASMQGGFHILKNVLHYRIAQLNENQIVRSHLMRSDSVFENHSKDVARVLLKDDGEQHKEHQSLGSVKLNTYLVYFKMTGLPWLVFIVFGLFLTARACQAFTDIFISKWATWEETQPNKHETPEQYIPIRAHMVLIYSILMISTLLLYLIRTFGFFHMCLKISLRLHDYLFQGIIHASMAFFALAPSGRILNRFASDIANIDSELPEAMMDSIEFYINALAVLLVVAIANHWLLLPTVLVIALLYFCRNFYVGASRSLKRIEFITRSPIYSHTNQTFHGLTTIRALNAAERLEREFHRFQNVNTSAMYLYLSVNRAFAFWTDLICVLYILAVTFSFLLTDRQFLSGDVGLAITQSMTLVIMCQWGMRQTSETENNMTSVERILEYAEVPAEPSFETAATISIPSTWPTMGQIRFNGLKLRYTETGDYVLKELHFTIRPKEKLGIVGHSGSGKSSIIQALFRLAINEGIIEIDGIDIGKLDLHALRSHISIIPQDPVLFSGTLRYNLDPFEEKTDNELWQALEDVKLKPMVSMLKGGLNCCLHDATSNFSMGQRQLVCMARAILRHNKILIMDEATANVDSDTDQLIQEAIHTKFSNCTVLTIAHRLHTIMDNDRVLVMKFGRMVELGHPYELLQNKNGFFYRFVERCGVATANHLYQIAEESYHKRVTHKLLDDTNICTDISRL